MIKMKILPPKDSNVFYSQKCLSPKSALSYNPFNAGQTLANLLSRSIFKILCKKNGNNNKKYQ